MDNENNQEVDEVVEVHWAGRSILLKKSMLDGWFNQSFEAREYYYDTHPDIEKYSDIDAKNYVVIAWEGKNVLVPRSQLHEWYGQTPEEHKKFVEDHQDKEVNF